MERALKAESFDPMRTLGIVVARLYETIGWAGFGGLSLIAVASVIAGAAWTSSTAPLPSHDEGVTEPKSVVPNSGGSPVPMAKASMNLPYRGDVPRLLTLIQQGAAGNGLGWSAANYRIAPATENEPSMLEVRCNFKGPYPRLRGMVAQLLRTVPSLTLRELSLSRPNSGVADVDAKLVLAVFLQDDPPASGGQRKGAAP